MNYFKYAHPLRRWKTMLAVGLPLIAVLWIGWMAFAKDQSVYSEGPVSASHKVIGDRCEVCHVSQPGSFREHATDLACLSCHDGPNHTSKSAMNAARQPIQMECGTCHFEHKGAVLLASVDDKSCLVCHNGLSIGSGEPAIVRNIGGFNAGHPEFAVLREKKADPGTIKFNHEVHMRANIRGPKGQAQLECDDCHRSPVGMPEAWPYGEAALRSVKRTVAPRSMSEPVRTGPMMMRIEYARSCDACHQLEFDKNIPDTVPHAKLIELKDKPDEVYAFARGFMERKFREYLAKNPNAWREGEAVQERRIPGRPPEISTAPRSPQEWMAARMAVAEKLLWDKTCKLCHSVSAKSGAGTLQVARVNVTTRWMPRSEFDHGAHKMMKCDSCHAATKSKDTADVLMPSIQNCQSCHRQGGAENRCYECHTYHDWSQQQRTRAKYSIEQLLRGVRPQPASTPAATPAAK